MGNYVIVEKDSPRTPEELCKRFDNFRSYDSSGQLTDGIQKNPQKSKVWLWTTEAVRNRTELQSPRNAPFERVLFEPRMFHDERMRKKCYLALVMSNRDKPPGADRVIRMSKKVWSLFTSACEVLCPMDIYCPSIRASKKFEELPIKVAVYYWGGRDATAISLSLGLSQAIKFRRRLDSILSKYDCAMDRNLARFMISESDAELEDVLLDKTDAGVWKTVPLPHHPISEAFCGYQSNFDSSKPTQPTALDTTIFAETSGGQMSAFATPITGGQMSAFATPMTSRSNSVHLSPLVPVKVKLDLTSVAPQRTELLTNRVMDGLSAADRNALLENLDEGLRKVTKLKYFKNKCSKITENIYISGRYVAMNYEILQECKIKYIINCVGDICEDYHRDKGVQYLTLCMKDSNTEELLMYFPMCFDFMDTCLRDGLNVLVHCEKGVSRSPSIVIGYLMAQTGLEYETIFHQVKNERSIVGPNIAFMCQLFSWNSFLQDGFSQSYLCKMEDTPPGRIVHTLPRLITNVESGMFTRSDVLIQRQCDLVFLWVGSESSRRKTEAGVKSAEMIARIYRRATVWRIDEDQCPESKLWISFCKLLGLDPVEEYTRLLQKTNRGRHQGMLRKPRTPSPKPLPRTPSPKQLRSAATHRSPKQDPFGLYVYDTWHKIAPWDEDDLISDCCMILIPALPQTSTFIWIGEKYLADLIKLKADVSEKLKEFKLVHKVAVCREYQESDAFWDAFYAEGEGSEASTI